MAGDLILACYVCGQAMREGFNLVSMQGTTDRPFTVHEKCSEQLTHSEVQILAVVPVLKSAQEEPGYGFGV
jgi:hypothetical protein